VPTDTHGRSGYVRVIIPWHLNSRALSMADQIGHRELVGAIGRTCAVSCEWSSKNACCSEVHSSYPARTIFPDNFTRPSVRARRGRENFGKTRSRRPNTGVSVFSPSMRHLRGTRVAISGTRVRNPHFLLFHVFWKVFMKKHTSPRASGADPPQTMVTTERIAHSTPQVHMLSYPTSGVP
jgi:hypothetical protein